MALLFQAIYSGLVNGSVYGLLGLGLVLCFRSTRMVNLAHGQTYVAAALVTVKVVGAGAPLIVGIVCGLLVAVIFSVALERWILRPRSSWQPQQLIIVVVGVSLAAEGVAYLLLGPDDFSFASLAGSGTVKVFGAIFTWEGIVVIAMLVVGALLVSWILHGTVFGQAMSASAENPRTAALLGINVGTMRMVSYAVAGLLGGLSAVLVVPLSSFTYEDGLTLTLLGYIAAALAAMRSPLGACVAGLVVGVAESLVGAYVNQLLAQPLVLGVLMIAAVTVLSRRIRFGGVVRA